MIHRWLSIPVLLLGLCSTASADQCYDLIVPPIQNGATSIAFVNLSILNASSSTSFYALRDDRFGGISYVVAGTCGGRGYFASSSSSVSCATGLVQIGAGEIQSWDFTPLAQVSGNEMTHFHIRYLGPSAHVQAAIVYSTALADPSLPPVETREDIQLTPVGCTP